MEEKELAQAGQNTHLIKTLSTLKEIGASINGLGMAHDLPTTLHLIAEGAVRVVAIGNENEAGAEASAVIWVYDEGRGDFDARSRVSAGEPEGASFDDFPRPNGLGRQAIRQRGRLLSYQVGASNIHPLKYQAGARSLVCYPLIANDEIVGLLYVYRCDEGHFSDVELLILDNFVQLAAMAIYHGRQVGGLTQALTRKVQEMEKLRRASNLISSRANLQEMLKEILVMGLDMTAAQYGSFEMYDKTQNLLVTGALAGSKARVENEPTLPLNEESVVGRAACRRESQRIDDLHDPQWREIYKPLLEGHDMRSELAVPLIGAGGKLEGVLNIESPQPNAFSKEDQQLLEALAVQAVIAIQEIRLLDAMQEIVQVLLTSPLDDLLKLIVGRACALINVPTGYLWIVTGPDTLALRHSTEDERIRQELPLKHSFTGQAIRLKKPIVIDDVRSDPDFLNPELAQEKGWVSAIVVPLLGPVADEAPVGSFSLYDTRLRDFSEWDKKVLTCLANHAAVAIRDAEQLAQLQATQQRQAIAETFAAVGDVGANLLHQLNNKFGAISVRVQGIEDKCTPALESWPYLAENLQDIAYNTRQAMTIVRDSMAQLQPASPAFVDILPCVERALQRAEPPAEIEITIGDLAQLPPVWAGERQLEMVFYNLIDNALRAMAGQGKLFITGQEQGNQVAICFADTGPGIPMEKQSQVFEFTPVAEKSTAGRLGFGLWWVKTFVDRFGGRIEINSQPGQGSAFTVWLLQEAKV